MMQQHADNAMLQPYLHVVAPAGKRPMPKEVAEAVIAVMDEVGYVQKKGKNDFHNYKFTKMDDLLAKIQPAMVNAGLIIVQDELRHGPAFDGKLMEAEYEFTLHTKSGIAWDERTKHSGTSAALNSKGGVDDKALNKCHSAARKYFQLALFQIPTGDLPDPDAEEDKGPPTPQATRPPVQVNRNSATTPAPTAAPVAAATPEDADWKIWIDGFKVEFSDQPTYSQGIEVCNHYNDVLQTLAEQRPDMAADLRAWIREAGAKLPKAGV